LITDTVNFAWRPDWQPLFSNGTINRPSDNYWTGIVYGKKFASVPRGASGDGINSHYSGLLLCTVWEQAARNGSCELYVGGRNRLSLADVGDFSSGWNTIVGEQLRKRNRAQSSSIQPTVRVFA